MLIRDLILPPIRSNIDVENIMGRVYPGDRELYSVRQSDDIITNIDMKNKMFR